MNINVLLLSFISGLFFLLGFLITKIFKKSENLNTLSTSMALVVMLGMLFLDLIPEVIELSSELKFSLEKKICFIILFIVVGVLFLKIFDLFLPHHEHHHDHEKKKEHTNHQEHVGLILSLPLIIHNVLEGMSMYLVGINSFKAGALMSIGVGLHNMPLGIEISSNIKHANNKKKVLILLGLVISTFVGSFLIFILNNNISNLFMFPLLAIASGMIIYIALFELLIDVIKYRKDKHTYYGLLIGTIIVIFMMFI